MTIQGNHGASSGLPDTQGITLGHRLAALEAAPDCGANPEIWTEIFIQLWGVNEDCTHKPAGTFRKFTGKVIGHPDLGRMPRLAFGFGDGARPIERYRTGQPRSAEGVLRIALSPRSARCSPRDRREQG